MLMQEKHRIMKSFAKYSLFQLSQDKIKSAVRKSGEAVGLFGFEGLVWIAALVYLGFFFNPGEAHFTICPLSNFGFADCPGCGLGRSVSLLMHGHVAGSFEAHMLGIPAVLILLFRIVSIVRTNININKILKSESEEYYA